MFFQFVKHGKVRVVAARWVGWGPEMAVGAERLLPPPGLGKYRVMTSA
jgi:hypothetical protein